ncbi:MAG TPA: helix-turn-helix transcriptional regulator [Candidatus Saccharimonadales bacterium]|nr:helix-turn-helix transcriptional regulator [Candidatus Saccharimonadales bacterium]
MTRDGPLTAEELRKRLLALSDKQRQLHAKLLEYMTKNACSTNTVANRADISRSSVSEFHAKRTAICGGKTLNGLCQLLDCGALGEEIEDLAKPIVDRYKTVSLFSKDVIVTFTDLLGAYQDSANRTTMKEFAQAFGEHSELVATVLNASRDGLETLTDRTLQGELLSTLIDGVEGNLNAVRAQKQQTITTAIQHLDSVIEQLLVRYQTRTAISDALDLPATTLRHVVSGRASLEKILEVTALVESLLHVDPTDPHERLRQVHKKLVRRYGTKVAVAKALNIPRSTLDDVLNSKRPNPEQLGRLLQKAEQLLSGSPGTTAQPAPSRPSSSPALAERTPIPSASSTLALAGLGGVTTDEGVPYVLTAESFQQLADVPLVALSETLCSFIQMTRLLLNIGSQVQDDTTRKVLRDGVGKEVEELQSAIEAFTFAHPNRLLDTLAAQREWRSSQTRGSKEKS